MDEFLPKFPSIKTLVFFQQALISVCQKTQVARRNAWVQGLQSRIKTELTFVSDNGCDEYNAEIEGFLVANIYTYFLSINNIPVKKTSEKAGSGIGIWLNSISTILKAGSGWL